MGSNTQINTEFKVSILLGFKNFFTSSKENDENNKQIDERIEAIKKESNLSYIEGLEKGISEIKIEKHEKAMGKKQEKIRIEPTKPNDEQKRNGENIIKNIEIEDKEQEI